jgi:pilus assembly protein CpaC
VSDIDNTLGSNVGGVNIPGVKTRRASTTIELGDGESFMIAGLLSNDMDNAIDQLPGVGDVPVLGALFRSTDYQRNETELVIAVTPRLVKPVSAGDLIHPTDGFVPPSDIDQYFRGKLEGTPDKSGGIEGAHGHQL